jgi:hypothetical protein
MREEAVAVTQRAHASIESGWRNLCHGRTADTIRMASRITSPRSHYFVLAISSFGFCPSIRLPECSNKNARVLWALLAHNEDYQAPAAAGAAGGGKVCQRSCEGYLQADGEPVGPGTLQTCRTVRALSPFA